MKHVAWDKGACRDAFTDVFGSAFVNDVLKQKTSKTLCGKRVSMSAIDNQTTDCPNCLAELKREQEGLAVLREIDESIRAGKGIPAKYLAAQ